MDWLERALVDAPRPEFRARLKSDLERTAAAMAPTTDTTETTPRVRQSATPQLRVKNAPAAIAFYTRAFGAREIMRFEAGGSIPHAELLIGNSVVFLGEEAPDYGYLGPESLGGSPVSIQLLVEDADAMVAQAVAAGARVTSPLADQFYGDRTGRVTDPFGHSWTIVMRKEEMSVDEMYRRMAAIQGQRPAPDAQSFRPEGFHTVTPYIIVQDAPALIDFVTRTFDADERSRDVGSAGGVHAEVRIGDSRVMIGGGAPELAWRGEPLPSAFHVYVKDTDAVFERAVQAGATVIGAPADMEYGERSAGVKDASGNVWYIATAKGASYVPEGLHTVNVYLHPHRAAPVIAFMTRAFGADRVEKYASPDGVIHHASVHIGDSVIEMGEAHGPYQPMPTMFYLYVPNADAAYHRAMEAGATSISAPADQPYGDRSAGVKDVFGNQWYIATQIRPRA
jgi:PhnB protein